MIENAGYCDHFKLGDPWMWEENGERRFVRLADCQIQQTKRFAQSRARARREHYTQHEKRIVKSHGD